MLNFNHIRTLKRIKRNKEIRCERPNKDLDYLYENGYIEMTVCDKPGDYFAQPYLTEKGKAKLYDITMQTVHKWVPIAISLIALVKSFLPELTWLWQQIVQLLK